MKTIAHFNIGKLIGLFFLFIGLSSFLYLSQDDGNFAHFIVKSKSEWGTKCEKCVEYDGWKRNFDDTYKVWMTNTGEEKMDVKCCVQEADKTWRCFFMNSMAPNKDTLIAYACKGTGKYLRWAKKEGDTGIIFPSDTEINEEFKD